MADARRKGQPLGEPHAAVTPLSFISLDFLVSCSRLPPSRLHVSRFPRGISKSSGPDVSPRSSRYFSTTPKPMNRTGLRRCEPACPSRRVKVRSPALIDLDVLRTYQSTLFGRFGGDTAL